MKQSEASALIDGGVKYLFSSYIATTVSSVSSHLFVIPSFYYFFFESLEIFKTSVVFILKSHLFFTVDYGQVLIGGDDLFFLFYGERLWLFIDQRHDFKIIRVNHLFFFRNVVIWYSTAIEFYRAIFETSFWKSATDSLGIDDLT